MLLKNQTINNQKFMELLKIKLVISFNIGDIHAYDIGSIIDNLGIAVRTGHHCAQPIMDYYKIPGTIRVSFCFYNNFDEIDKLVNALNRAVKMLS